MSHRQVAVLRGRAPLVPYESLEDCRESRSEAVTKVMMLLSTNIEDIRIRSCFERRLMWTAYDELMLGSLDERLLYTASLSILLGCTRERGVGWCRQVSKLIVAAARSSLEQLIAMRFRAFGLSPHHCTPETRCWCVQAIINTMQCRVTQVLTSPGGGWGSFRGLEELCRASFVLAWPRRVWLEIHLALAMSQHPRLGRESPLGVLGADMLQLVVRGVLRTLCK